MDHSTVKNICSEMIHEQEQSRQAIGCPTAVGCFKGKELENLIKGPMYSKLSDLKTAQSRQEEINAAIQKKQSAIIELSHESAASSAACATSVKAMEKKGDEMVTNSRWIIVMLVLAVIGFLGSNWYLARPKQDELIHVMKEKIQQDADNQIETVKYLQQLEKHLNKAGE